MNRTITIKGIEYEVLNNPNNFNLEVDKNTLVVMKGFTPSERNITIVTFELEKTDLETIIEVLYKIGIVLEETMQTAFDMWREKNPRKTYEQFITELKRIYLNIKKMQKPENPIRGIS
ncbi:hypothetical protein [Cetobacterium sp.]|uniref:hypothetical protein n=1 Tax=Cetobacterium sp. TaxID=2071632 RepID=UPI003EE789C5